MLLFFIEWCKHLGISIPHVFEYVSTRMVLAVMTALLLTILCGKFFIKKLYEWKIGDKVRTEDCPLLGELHHNKNDTPTMGGVLILFSCLISLFLWMDLRNSFTLLLFVVTSTMGGLGAVDDFLKLKNLGPKGLSAKKKLAGQCIIAAIVAFYLLSPFLNSSIHWGKWFTPPTAKEHVLSQSAFKEPLKKIAVLTTREYASTLYFPCLKNPLFRVSGLGIVGMGLFMIFIIVGSSNAVNLTDGLDGLATGTVMLAASAFSIIAFVTNHSELSSYLNITYVEGAGEIAIFLSAVAGACLGFLWYNGPPAQVFMGDTGSLALGAILGLSAVLLKKEILLGIIGGVFVIEALSVILQVGSYKFRNKKRIFLIAPLHHHFEYKGWPESKVVLRFWIMGLLLAVLGIATLKFQ